MDNPILPEYIQTIQVDQGLAIKEKRLNLNMTQKNLQTLLECPNLVIELFDVGKKVKHLLHP